LAQELGKFPVVLFYGEALAKDMQAFSFIRVMLFPLFPFLAARGIPCMQPSVQRHRANPRWSTFSPIPNMGEWKSHDALNINQVLPSLANISPAKSAAQ
jgi:hypothetical protein